MICNSCPRKCNIDREKVTGYCGVAKMKVAKVMTHFWEEPIICDENGSGAIFFSGCNLKCNYCQNYKITHEGKGKDYTPEMLAKVFEDFDNSKVNNINLVTPSHFIDEIVKAFEIYKPHKPVVYNSSGYDDVESLKKIDKYVDIYLVDLKYVDSDLSQRLSKAKDYFSVSSKAINFMLSSKPQDIFKNGILSRGVIIRHLVLPNHTDDGLRVLDYLKSLKLEDRYISLMGQYTPCYHASEDINRPIKKLEYTRVISYFNKLGFTKGFCQELSSSSTDFIPEFDSEEN